MTGNNLTTVIAVHITTLHGPFNLLFPEAEQEAQLSVSPF